jgi:hypothetical protein
MARESFIGRAGQLAVMAEFLLRGYNVAIPEVDVGDDIFVVSDRAEQLWRVQVKTAIGVKRSYGYSGQFFLPLNQLKQASKTALFYLFSLRRNSAWEFMAIPQQELYREYLNYQIGSPTGENLVLYFAFKAEEVMCGNRNLQRYRNNWARWPVTEPGGGRASIPKPAIPPPHR